MRPRYRVAPKAERDIDQIGAYYVACYSDHAAERLIADFYSAFALLADMPELGHSRDDLTSLALRFWPVRKRYLIVYRAVVGQIEIIRLLDGHRDVPRILRDR